MQDLLFASAFEIRTRLEVAPKRSDRGEADYEAVLAAEDVLRQLNLNGVIGRRAGGLAAHGDG